jgi:putative spermidine/putrescine transport system permease protein
MAQWKPRRIWRWAGALLVLVILAFVLCPVVVVTIAAFNAKAILAFPPEGFSLRWFQKALIALGVGTAFALAIDRHDFKGKNLLAAVLVSPLVIPNFTIGLGMLILTADVGWARGYGVLVLTHVILVLPFVLRSIYVSLRNLDRRLEFAAASLGAPPLRVLLTVTLPLLLPGLVSGWLFAAILSFNEFTASLFITVQRTQTLPVAMYNYVREFADPSMAALSVLYIAATAFLLVIANMFLGLGKVLNVESGR